MLISWVLHHASDLCQMNYLIMLSVLNYLFVSICSWTKPTQRQLCQFFSSKEINLNFVLAHISAYKSKYSKALGTDH